MTPPPKPKLYRLNKARQRLQWAYKWYKKNASSLSDNEREALEGDLKALDAAVLAGDREGASMLAQKVERFVEPRYKRSFWSYGLELIFALAIALLVACVVRQMWFENQEIPSGSMRPTYKEQDHLIVSKAPFGINIPFLTDHFYFDPNLIERTAVFTFSADNIPMQDADTTYFGIFPYKKRLIKRLMGKPGDTLYFYGGQVYGIDDQDKPIKEFLENPWMKDLEYIPFLNFTGNVEQTHVNTFILKQMGEDIGKVIRQNNGQLTGQIFNGQSWIPDNPLAALKPHAALQTYSDFWGMHNFAMAQLLTKEQLASQGDGETATLSAATLYLELRHTPNLSNPAPRLVSQPYGTTLALTPLRTYIPLESRHLNALMDSLYTARFIVEGGHVRRYGADERPLKGGWRLDEVPDGTYEFYHGKAYQVGLGGITYELPPESPLYNRSIAMIQQLFNLGIDIHPAYTPHRYAYFRHGDLYLMGSPILKKGDTTLEAFLAREADKQKRATKEHPYTAFHDYGPPVSADGRVEVSFLKAFGLKIPAKHYLALGDNHAMSGDSRVWGFVPEENIQGAPSFIFWPPGARWGPAQNQPATGWITAPHIIVWTLIALIGGGALVWYFLSRRRSVFKN